jgi:pSer/pThr/pTyr-binding forkhead associated (FHA) protein
MGSMVTCSNCGAEVPVAHRFCGKCGHPQKQAEAARGRTEFFGGQPTAGRAKLVLIRGEGMDGVSYQLNAAEHIAGRKAGAILFPEDHYLSPRHANFYYDQGRLFVRDEGSLNGVFARIRTPVRLNQGDVFLAGEELLRVQWNDLGGSNVGVDHTHFFASPFPDASRRVTQIFEGGRPGLCHLVGNSTVTIGRENCDIEFPHDRFISGRHCKVEFDGEGAAVTDLGSRNGTYVRVNGQRALEDGDYLFVGKQLLRVEIAS